MDYFPNVLVSKNTAFIHEHVFMTTLVNVSMFVFQAGTTTSWKVILFLIDNQVSGKYSMYDAEIDENNKQVRQYNSRMEIVYVLF